MSKKKVKEKKKVCKCGHSKEVHYDTWGSKDYTGCSIHNCGCVVFKETITKPDISDKLFNYLLRDETPQWLRMLLVFPSLVLFVVVKSMHPLSKSMHLREGLK